MRNIFILFLSVVFICGCASVPSKYDIGTYGYEKEEFVELNNFCKKHKLHYSFNTLDDILVLSSKSLEMKLLLASSLLYFNGAVVSVKKAPFYSRGRIFVPRELSRIISSKSMKIINISPILVKTIVIDPGHGGKDPGAISRKGLMEKDVNLKISKYLRDELKARGFRVYLTRETDVYLTLKQRVRFAKKYNADLFISMHANANHSRKVSGVEVYYLSERYFDSESKAVALAENSYLSFNNAYFSKDTERIIWDLICVENNTQSLDFANSLVRIFKRTGFKVKQPRGAPFYVLKYACTPSVLFEAGYLSNSYEEKLLRQPYYQKQIAHSIALSIDSLNKRYARLANISK